MKFVLDTNAVSETARPRPNSGLLTWHNRQNPEDLAITTITLAEAWFGFYKLPSHHKDYDRIKRFASGLRDCYRVLNFDARSAAIWGKLAASADGPLPLRDSLIAAIARSRGYRVVTRDVEPFERMGCKVIQPWT